MKVKALFFAGFLLAAACSNTYRTSDPQISADQLKQYLSEAQSNAFSGSGDISTLANDPNTTIYFADAPGPMGTVASVLSFDDISFIGSSTVGSSVANVGAVRVFLLDNPFSTAARQDILIIGVASKTDPGTFEYKTFSGSGQLDSGQFTMTFTGGDGVYSARSFDLDGDSLAANIQLKIFTPDADGNDVYVGKFPVLAGFQ
ncbi:MAG: hypothetical protein ACXWQE_10435 [Bdellovibrionales bacterium]